MPNSAVKASSANGTAAQAAGESVVASPAKDRKQKIANTISSKTPPEQSGGVFVIWAGDYLPTSIIRTRHDIAPIWGGDEERLLYLYS